MNIHNFYRMMGRVYHHAILHLHEVAVALLLEGSRIHIALFLALVGAMFIVFAFQVFIQAESE